MELQIPIILLANHSSCCSMPEICRCCFDLINHPAWHRHHIRDIFDATIDYHWTTWSNGRAVMALASGVDMTVVIPLYQQRLLVRKSVGSNPTLINIFAFFFLPGCLQNKGWASSFERPWTNRNDFWTIWIDCEWCSKARYDFEQSWRGWNDLERLWTHDLGQLWTAL